LIDIAFVTCAELPEMTADDALVAEVLRQRGCSVVSAVWDDTAVEWPRFSGVVIRSVWDYHLREREYAEWLQRRGRDGSRVWNSPQAVLANLNKIYLREFSDAGLDVVPMEYVDRGDPQRLEAMLERRGWRDVVVKPAVSASAYGTWRSSLATAARDQRRFERDARQHALLVQPFAEEVASQGEWSLVFFDDEYSHAVLKRPASGDFRVQEELGGIALSTTAPSSLIDQAQRVLSHVGMPLVYARVDGIERAGRFVLMELEINEPFLYIAVSEGAAVRFAETVIRYVRAR